MSTDIENIAYATLNTYAVLAHGTLTGNTANINKVIISGDANGSYGTVSGTVVDPNSTIEGFPDQANVGTANGQLATFVAAVNTVRTSFTSVTLVTATLATGYTFSPSTNYNNNGASGINVGGDLIFNAGGDPSAQFFITVTGNHTLNFIGITSISLLNGADAKNIFWQMVGSSSTAASINFKTTVNAGNIPGIFMYTGTSAASTATNGITVQVPSSVIGRFYTQAGPINFTQVGYSGSLGASVDGNFDGILCYAKGTLILTNKGFVPIETIKEGDKLVTKGKIFKNKFIKEEAPFKTNAVTWISKFKPRRLNSKSLPICIKKDALGENYPFADLYVSPGHRLLLDGKMVLSTDLINNKTIYQDNEYDGVEYYHLECDHHRAIVANGVLSETFLELDNSKRVFNKPNAVRAKK